MKSIGCPHRLQGNARSRRITRFLTFGSQSRRASVTSATMSLSFFFVAMVHLHFRHAHLVRCDPPTWTSAWCLLIRAQIRASNALVDGTKKPGSRLILLARRPLPHPSHDPCASGAFIPPGTHPHPPSSVRAIIPTPRTFLRSQGQRVEHDRRRSHRARPVLPPVRSTQIRSCDPPAPPQRTSSVSSDGCSRAPNAGSSRFTNGPRGVDPVASATEIPSRDGTGWSDSGVVRSTEVPEDVGTVEQHPSRWRSKSCQDCNVLTRKS